MTYGTPELRLVGAAQNLVLDDQPSEIIGCQPEIVKSEYPELW
jgi:hypothetical protein